MRREVYFDLVAVEDPLREIEHCQTIRQQLFVGVPILGFRATRDDEYQFEYARGMCWYWNRLEHIIWRFIITFADTCDFKFRPMKLSLGRSFGMRNSCAWLPPPNQVPKRGYISMACVSLYSLVNQFFPTVQCAPNFLRSTSPPALRLSYFVD